MNPEQKIIELEKKLVDLQMHVERIDKQAIKIVGDVGSTTVPVTLNGIKRKITHAAP